MISQDKTRVLGASFKKSVSLIRQELQAASDEGELTECKAAISASLNEFNMGTAGRAAATKLLSDLASEVEAAAS